MGAASAEPGVPSISTDAADYPPGATVTLSGANWNAGDNVHVVVDDVQGQTWQWQGDATAGDNGGFDLQFTLPEWFVADYSVLADNGLGSNATTTFTDSNVQVAAKVGTTGIVAGVAWTTYRKSAACSGTTLNSGNVNTDPTGNGFTGTSGVGNTTAMSLLAASPVVYNGRLYTFSSWTGDLAGAQAFLCVPGDTLNGKISETANYTDAGSATKQAQTITFAALADKTYGDADFTVAATASSGLTVVFSAVGACTVSGTTVHITGVGDCTITADQAGNASYYAAPSVIRSFTVNQGGTTVTVSCPVSQVYTGSAITPCTATATGSGLNQALTVTYTNNVNVGTAGASASFAGDATHAPGSGSATFAIDQAPSTVAITCPASVAYTGLAQTPCTALATGAGSLSQSVTPTYSANTNVGTVTVSASYAGDANHTGNSNSTTFTIAAASSTTTITCPATATYTGLALTPCSASVTGANLNLTPTPAYSNNTNVGTATASYSYAGDTNHSGSSGSRNFDITKAGSTVTVTCPGTWTYTGSAIEPCSAAATGAGGLNEALTVTYTNNVGAGTATASATWVGDDNHGGSNSSTTFVIGKAASTVTLVCTTNETYTGSAIEPCSATVAGANLSGSVPVTYTTNTNAGSAGASATYAGDANHFGDTAADSFTIDQAGSTVTVSCTSPQTYTGSALTPCSASATGAGGLNAPLTVSYTNNTNAGTAGASASYAGDANHTSNSGNATFTILKAASVTAVSCPPSVVYDGSAQTPCTVSVTGVGGLNLTPAASYANNVSAGTATASYNYAGDLNHGLSSDTKYFSIGKAGSTTTVTCPTTNPVYTGSPIEPCSAVTTGAGALSESQVVTYASNTDAGTATASASYPGDLNHESSSDSKDFTIDKASSTTALSCTSPVTYSGSALTPCTVAVTGAGALSTTTTIDYTSNTNAGTGHASATYTGDSNHNGSSDAKDFTISKASSVTSLSCTTPQTFTGSAIEPCTSTVTGAGALSTSAPILYSGNLHAGTAYVSSTYGGDSNHNGSSDSTTFAIGKAGSTTAISCSSAVQYTGAALTPCSASVTGAGGLSESLPVTYSANTAVGTASASASFDGDADHNGSSDSESFAITKASSTTTVTCPASQMYTGSAIEPCTAAASGIGGLSVTGLAVTYTANHTDVGPITASASYGGDANHDGSNGSSGFAITKAPTAVTVTCPVTSTTYTGSVIQPCTARVTGAGGLDQALTVSYGSNVNVGTATAAASYAGDTNHDGNSGSATFVISKASSTVTVTCPTTAQVYTGSAITPCSAQATGAALDVPVTPVTYTDNVVVGTGHASATYAGDLNHTGSTGAGTFAIEKASSTVTVTCPATRTYTGSAIEPCTAKATGAGMADVTGLAVTYSADHTNVGSVTASGSWAGDANHTGNTGSSAFTIDPAVLTVTAVDKARQYSDADPAFTATISGFVGGQNLTTSGVTGAPTCTSPTAVFDSPYVPGGYPITCTQNTLAASNYSFSFVAGTLTVNKEDALIDFPGSTFFISPGATDPTMNVPVSALLKEAQDGSLGARLTSMKLVFTATATSNGSNTSCMSDWLSVTGQAAGIASGGCTLTGLAVGDAFQLHVTLVENGYYTAPQEDLVITTTNSGTGFMTGGGWFNEPNTSTRSNFGFNAKSTKRGVQGSSLYIYRKVLSAPETVNGVLLPAGSYNWIVKSNSVTSLTMSCPASTPGVCNGSFLGKSTLKAVNRTTGVSYGLGGNQTFQIDVTDKGEPGSSSSTSPDTYGIKVSNGTSGTYYTTGTGSSIAQIALKGGNIQVRP